MGDENELRPEGGTPDGGGGRGVGDRGGSGPETGSGADAGAEEASPGPRRHRADETLRTGALPEAVECPHCGETESEQFSAFGSAVSVSQYYCRSCRTVFEFFKWR